MKGTNYAEVGVQPGDVADGKRVVACFAATDNLIKGGAGQAIQSMNLMLGPRRAADARGPGRVAVSGARTSSSSWGARSSRRPTWRPSRPTWPRCTARGERRRPRARRRPAGDRPAEEARADAEDRRRPPHHRRRDARGHEDDRRRQGERRRVRRARWPRARSPWGCTARARSRCAPSSGRRASSPARGPDPIDFGHVGDVTGVNDELLAPARRRGLRARSSRAWARTREGRVYNINADIVANRLAIALDAQGAGARQRRARRAARRRATPASRIPRLSRGRRQEGHRRRRRDQGDDPEARGVVRRASPRACARCTSSAGSSAGSSRARWPSRGASAPCSCAVRTRAKGGRPREPRLRRSRGDRSLTLAVPLRRQPAISRRPCAAAARRGARLDVDRHVHAGLDARRRVDGALERRRDARDEGRARPSCRSVAVCTTPARPRRPSSRWPTIGADVLAHADGDVEHDREVLLDAPPGTWPPPAASAAPVMRSEMCGGVQLGVRLHLRVALRLAVRAHLRRLDGARALRGRPSWPSRSPCRCPSSCAER